MTGVDDREWFAHGEWVAAQVGAEAESITRARSDVQAAEIVQDHNSLVAAVRDAQDTIDEYEQKWNALNGLLRDAQAENEQLRERAERHGECIGCNYNDGPDEFCPQHGRTYSDLLGVLDRIAAERDEARAALARVTALCDEYRANCDPTSIQAQVAVIFRAAVQGDANPEATDE